MKRFIIISVITTFLFGSAFVLIHSEESNSQAKEYLVTDVSWAMNATAIEACTCPMFCQCYFNTEPAGHSHGGHGEHGEEAHYCRFNMAWKINSGHHGNTDLEGALFWIAGDLGESFADATGDWAVLHFDPSVTDEQREGIANILAPLFPITYDSFGIEQDMMIDWQANTQEAVALLDGGNVAEMRLVHPVTAMSEEPAVLTNIIYWGAPRHDGFVMMPNKQQGYYRGEKAFESSGTNGFMITIDINSDDI